MKNHKIKERFENAVEAFFQNDEQFEESRIVPYNNSVALLDDFSQEENDEKIDSTISFVKLAFLFLPGSFFLFKVTLLFAYIAKPYPHYLSNLGKFDYYFAMFLIENSLLGLFFVLAATFMTFVGVGSLKETKNLAVPGLVISLSLLLFGICSFLPEPFRADVVMYYSTYLFPIILTLVWFVKSWIDKFFDPK